MYCSRCGQELKEGQRFCTKCGLQIQPNQMPNNFNQQNIYQNNQPRNINMQQNSIYQKKIKMKTCKYCVSEIPKKAKKCPYCRKNTGTFSQRLTDFILYMAIIIFGTIFIVKACSSQVSVTPKTKLVKSEDIIDTYISEGDYNELFINPNDYKGFKIKYAGIVFNIVDSDDDYFYFQVFQNPNDDTTNTLVVAPINFSSKVKKGDYVIIDGVIDGKYIGENVLGVKTSAVQVESDKITVTDYMNAMSPTIKEIQINQEWSQYGYTIKFEKIEFSKIETRLYVTVRNNGNSTFYFRDYMTTILQNSKQYEIEYNYEADYDELPDKILKGGEARGIITFPVLDEKSDLQIYFSCASDDYFEEEFEDNYHIDIVNN